MKEGLWDEARPLYQAVLEKRPDFTQASYDLGIMAFQEGDFESAIGYFGRAAELSPKEANIRYLLATALTRYGDFERAKKVYRETIELNPRMMQAHHDLGLLHYRTGEYEKAIAALEEALKLYPASANSMLVLGMSQISLNKPEYAIEIVSKLRELKEELKAKSLENMLRIYQASKRPATPDENALNPVLAAPTPKPAGRPGDGRMSITGKAKINLSGKPPEDASAGETEAPADETVYTS
jgi:tetratricopeptide (TPR) repeat protein